MLALYVKALSHRPSGKGIADNDTHIPIMPSIEYEKTIDIHPKHCSAYNKLTQWQPHLAAVVHPNYVQTLSLPLQLRMMVDKAFPFSPMGMVHIANQITVDNLPEQSDSLHLRTFFGNVYFHRKGWLFEVHTLASSTTSKNAKMKATSFYLAKAKHSSSSNHFAVNEIPEWIAKANLIDTANQSVKERKKSLNFPSNIGIQYAKVSGDYNPIHLHPLCARLFGFKKAIAHGMYSKALVVSNIANQQHFYKSEFQIDTLFMQAISLPTKALLTSISTDKQSCDFQLSSASSCKERIFLTGSIR